MSLTRRQILALQTEKLQALLRAIAEGNAFYRPKLAAHLSDVDGLGAEAISDLPFTTKTELVEDQERNPPYGTNLTFPIEHYVRLHNTSGTTGEPLRWLDTKESWQWWLDCWQEVLTDAGVTAEDRVFVAFSFGPFIGFWTAFEAAQQLGALTLTGGSRSTEQRLDDLLRNSATVLVCTPTYALRLAEVARGLGIDLASSDVRLAVLAGEPGASMPNVKARIEEAWGGRAIDHAGATEVGAWGVTANDDGRMRILESQFIAEVIDPDTGKPPPPKASGALEGELVLTNLGRTGSPVIRYRTGDLVEMVPGSDSGNACSYLRGGVLARTDGMVVIRGVNVYPSAIENLVRTFPTIDEFQVRVETVAEMTELRLQIEVAAVIAAGVVDNLTRLISDKLGLRPQISVVPRGSLPRYELKAKRFQIVD